MPGASAQTPRGLRPLRSLALEPDAGAHGAVPSRQARWTGHAVSGVAVAFLLFDAAVKLLQLPLAVDATGQLGYPESAVVPLGLLQLLCTAVYLVPRSAPLGALLWTGYLGGAVATHMRVLSPLWTHTLFPVYVAALLWGGLWLRDGRVRALLARGQ